MEYKVYLQCKSLLIVSRISNSLTNFFVTEEASEDQSQSAAETGIHHIFSARRETHERSRKGQLAEVHP